VFAQLRCYDVAMLPLSIIYRWQSLAPVATNAAASGLPVPVASRLRRLLRLLLSRPTMYARAPAAISDERPDLYDDERPAPGRAMSHFPAPGPPVSSVAPPLSAVDHLFLAFTRVCSALVAVMIPEFSPQHAFAVPYALPVARPYVPPGAPAVSASAPCNELQPSMLPWW